MKFRVIAIIAILLAVVSGCAYSAAKPEFRAIQVHTWIPGMLSKQEIDDTIKWAKDANINVVILQARRVADAVYNSAYEPRATGIQGPKDFDPLAYGIQKCHENGMQAYAWFNVYRVWGGGKPSNPNHLVNKHPEWINKDFKGNSGSTDGVFVDPGVPEARAYTVKVLGDMLSKYDCDGIMLDFVRYPRREWGYSDIAVSRFNKQYNRTGKPDPNDLTWARWRREQVTQMVRDIYAEINRQKPWVALSAATVPWGGCPDSWTKTDAFAWVFQDWRLWMEQGILDVNMPMNYKDPGQPKNAQDYVDWVEGMKKWSYGRFAISVAMVMKNNADSAEGAVDQIKIARDHGLPGEGGFAFSQCPQKDVILKALKAKVYQEPAPVPEMPWKAKRPSTK